MTRKSPHERQGERDVERAETVIADARGLTGAQGFHVLGDRAAHAGISLHAAATAAVSTSPRDELRWESRTWEVLEQANVRSGARLRARRQVAAATGAPSGPQDPARSLLCRCQPLAIHHSRQHDGGRP